MKLKVCSIGKPALSFYKAGIAEYQKRLKRHGGVEIDHLRDAGRGKEAQSADLLTASEGCYRIVMDERGRDLTTGELVDFVRMLEARGDVKTVAFLIGGADGHSARLRDEGDAVIRLSALTMQHEQALLILMEQLYRVRMIQAGTPYHR